MLGLGLGWLALDNRLGQQKMEICHYKYERKKIYEENIWLLFIKKEKEKKTYDYRY